MTPNFKPAPLFFSGLFLTSTVYGQLSDGLISYLQFESDATSSAPVVGNDGTLMAGAVAGAADGLIGNALALDSSVANQHVNLPLAYGPATDLGQNFTISAWYNLNEFPAANGSSRYFVFEGDTNYEISYGLRDSGLGTAGPNDGQSYTGSGANMVIADAGLPGWQHVMQTYALENGEVTIRTFVNGVEGGTLVREAASMVGTGVNFGAARNSANNRGFDGLMDEVALWNRTLTPDEVVTAFLLGSTGQEIAGGDPTGDAPVIVSFEATPSEAMPGDDVTLSWEVTGSSTVWISGGVGMVDAQSSQSVSLDSGTSYTLIALNGNAPATSSLEIGVIYPPADLSNDLVAYYSVDRDLTNNAAASGPDAIGLNEPTAGAPGGLVGNALELSTTTNQHINTLVSFGGEVSDLGDQFTVMTWYRLNDVPEVNSSGRYFVFEAADNFDISYGLRDLGLGEPGFNDGQSFTEGASRSFGDAALEGWHQVIQRFTTNGVTTTIETFIDGEDLGDLSVSTANVSGTGINFGAPRSSVTNRGFDGLLDEMAIWSRPLTDEEIALTYELGSEGVGLLGSVAELAVTSVDYDAVTGVTTLEFVSSVGSTYAIDRSFDLEVWNELEDNYQADAELSIFEDSGAGPVAFYRVRRIN